MTVMSLTTVKAAGKQNILIVIPHLLVGIFETL